MVAALSQNQDWLLLTGNSSRSKDGPGDYSNRKIRSHMIIHHDALDFQLPNVGSPARVPHDNQLFSHFSQLADRGLIFSDFAPVLISFL